MDIEERFYDDVTFKARYEISPVVCPVCHEPSSIQITGQYTSADDLNLDFRIDKARLRQVNCACIENEEYPLCDAAIVVFREWLVTP